jgi:hypothetical protein
MQALAFFRPTHQARSKTAASRCESPLRLNGRDVAFECISYQEHIVVFFNIK